MAGLKLWENFRRQWVEITAKSGDYSWHTGSCRAYPQARTLPIDRLTEVEPGDDALLEDERLRGQ